MSKTVKRRSLKFSDDVDVAIIYMYWPRPGYLPHLITLQHN